MQMLIPVVSPSSCLRDKIINNIAYMLLFFTSMVTSTDDDVTVYGPDRVQEFYACAGSSAYIPWPLNVISREGHRTTVIYLSFQRHHSEKKLSIATFSGQQELTTDIDFKNRLSVSNENSGIFLEKTTIDDNGIYTAQARVNSSQIWTRSTNLTVLLRPMLIGKELNISKSEIIVASNGGHCINLKCGTLEFTGYPSATFVWTAPSKTLSMKSALGDFATSSIQICSPFMGNVTCSLTGFSSICTYDHMATVHVDLPEPASNRSVQGRSAGGQDLALTIVMPILAVLVPLAILGVWVLSHILKFNPQYRGQQHFGDRGPQIEIDVEENGITEHTHDNDGHSEDENDQTEVKDDNDHRNEESLHSVLGNNNNQHQHGGILSVVDDNTEDEESKGNEDRPLMNASISTAV